MKHPDQVVYTADGVDHNQVLDPSENSADYTIMSETGDADNEANPSLFPLDKLAAADLYGTAGTGGVETGSASGSNSVSYWSWNATTETLTQTAVSATETIYGTSVNDIIYGYGYGGSAPTSGTIALFGLDGTNYFMPAPAPPLSTEGPTPILWSAAPAMTVFTSTAIRPRLETPTPPATTRSTPAA